MQFGRLKLNFQNNLSAKKFVKNKTYKMEFNRILNACINAHELMIKNDKNIDNLEENKLRNKLIKYIDKNKGTWGVAKYVFNAEPAEIDDNTDETVGFHDIRVTIPCNSDFSNEEHKRFIIECKRLDGYSEKNKKYIEEGMNRFISEKYKCKLDVCGMIGFIEKSQKIYKKEKAQEIVEDINDKLINQYNKNQSEQLIVTTVNDNFNSAYKSIHNRTKCNLPINITHIFLDNSGYSI